MNFGKKIKELRQSKNIGQKEINLNQTTISQIENGKIPATVEHVKILADSFNVTFDDLVIDTDWKKPKEKNYKGIVYSMLDFKLNLDQYGSIQVDFMTYPRFDENGIENKFCPKTSSILISECRNCNRPIVQANHTFCMGCGNALFHKYQKTIDEVLGKNEKFVISAKNQLYLWYSIENLKQKIENVYKIEGTPETQEFDPDYLKTLGELDQLDENRIFINLKIYLEILNLDQYFVSLDDYIKGIHCKNEKLAWFHIERNFARNFYEQLIIELKKYLSEADEIDWEKEIEKDPTIATHPDCPKELDKNHKYIKLDEIENQSSQASGQEE
tara:strand:+ start:120 stop:1106 length:987 start_codon:yes stop_codon:yes gene_type:complete